MNTEPLDMSKIDIVQKKSQQECANVSAQHAPIVSTKLNTPL